MDVLFGLQTEFNMAYVLYVMDAVYEKSAEWKVSVLGITNREKLIAFSKSVKFLFIRTECQFQVLSMYVCVYVCMRVSYVCIYVFIHLFNFTVNKSGERRMTE